MEKSEYFWDDLLHFIEERSVIPVIGNELLTFEVDGKTHLLYQYLARKVAESLDISPNELPEGCTLDSIAYIYLQKPDSRREIMYRRMRSILNNESFPIPEPLKKLASITQFNLFITTTFDPLLERSIDEVRFSGKQKTRSIVYTLNEYNDLPSEIGEMVVPCVYYLFGHVSMQPNYVITEEDTLEFIHSLQSETKRPQLLFDELKKNNILLIGNSYSNWLSRFFIRTLRNERLTVPCGNEAILAGDRITKDESLVMFLSSPLSYGIKIFESGGAIEFVNELYSRWCEMNPSIAISEDKTVEIRKSTIDDLPEMESGAIFLSYASEDTETVAQVKEAIENIGLDVWFDKRRLMAGDDYDIKIQRNIRNCSLFCPFISQNTERRSEGYFRREWKYALDRLMNIDESIPFILPISIDVKDSSNSIVPAEFKRVQWTHLVEGRLPEEFMQRLVKLVRDYRKRIRGYL